MTCNCCIVIGHHLVCYQKTFNCEFPCECLIVRWFMAPGMDCSIIAGEWVHITPANSILSAKIQELTNLQKYWFCPSPKFNGDWIILIRFFFMPKHNEYIEIYARSRMYMSNSSHFCQCSGPWYFYPCWKASIALKVIFLEKQYVLKYCQPSKLLGLSQCWF